GADVLGDRGLGQKQRLGGPRKTPELYHLREDLEAAKVHQSETRFVMLLSDRRTHRRRRTCRTTGARRRSLDRTPTACASPARWRRTDTRRPSTPRRRTSRT